MRLLIAATLALSFLVACGDDDTGTRSGQPTEDSLRAAAQRYGDAFAEGEAVRAYSYLHEDYQAKCPQEDYISLIILGRAFFTELEDADYRISEVTVDGTRGDVRGDYYVDDRGLGFDENDEEYDSYWVFDEGK